MKRYRHARATRWASIPCLLALSLATGAAAAATGGNSTSGRDVAANCAACHGPDGRSRDAAIRSLAGMDKAAIISALRAFREGRRPSTVMQQLAKGYTAGQIAAAAAFFSEQKR